MLTERGRPLLGSENNKVQYVNRTWETFVGVGE